MKFILGQKQNMTQFFAEDGTCTPATVIQAGPVVVTQVKTEDTDGYEAVQVGYGETKDHRVPKAQKGHFKENGLFATTKEFRLENVADYSAGQTIDVTAFEPGDVITVNGISKGKGFQGAVKRHGFAGGPRTHGQKHSEREVGSIGATGPQRVFKNTRMAGRMGGDRISVKNIKVLAVDKDTNSLLVSGAVPGRKGTLIEVRG